MQIIGETIKGVTTNDRGQRQLISWRLKRKIPKTIEKIY